MLIVWVCDDQNLPALNVNMTHSDRALGDRWTDFEEGLLPW